MHAVFQGQIANLRQGEHLCSVYSSTEELKAQALPYIQYGLSAGERCVYVADEQSAEAVLAALSQEGTDTARYLAGGALVMWDRHHYRQPGDFDRQVMMDFVRCNLNRALDDGFSGLRLAVEMTWAPNANVSLAELVEWEAFLNTISFPGSKASFLCMYNQRLLPAALIREALYVHPVVVLGEQICPNLYYQPPQMVLDAKTDAEKLQWVVGQIKRADLAEKALARKIAELDAANAELERFVYAASHDLKEPLRMVSSYVQLLAKRYHGQLDTDADDFIRFAVDGVNTMEQIIHDTLSYAHVGRTDHVFQPVDCEALFEQVLRNLKVEIEDTGASVTHDGLPLVQGNAAQLRQVFQNLVHNALKFRGPQAPIVHVTARRLTVPSGDEWLFSVCDNGIGIEPQYYARIFEMFQRLHTKAEYAGTGIGLALCKKAVVAHGGKIWVESHPGKGSTFYFTLPVQDHLGAPFRLVPEA